METSLRSSIMDLPVAVRKETEIVDPIHMHYTPVNIIK